MSDNPLVPGVFSVPVPPDHELFRFEVLGPEHNTRDLEAWSTSIDHIHATPGFTEEGWPERVYTLEENRADLIQHRDHHRRGLDFAWTMLDPSEDMVLGCVYLKPDLDHPNDAVARSWVRVSHAELDRPLRAHLACWFRDAWPLSIRYAIQ